VNQKNAPAILMLVGGLLLAIAPWVGSLPINLDPIIPVDIPGSWVVVVEETSERSPAVARVQADSAYWDSLEGRGLKWRFYDVDSPDAASYVKPAKEAGIPALVVVAPEGRLLAAKPIPATTEGIDAIVKEVTGR
jgi:hypothetical protein